MQGVWSAPKPRLMILAEQWPVILEQSAEFVADDGRKLIPERAAQ
jgi:hypothetical protein